jgi:hypothetical protein
MGQRQRRLLADLHVGEVVVPDLFGLPALGEEQQVGFHARAGGGEDPAGQADDGPQVALVHQLALGLDKGALVGAEQQPLVEHDGAGALGASSLRMSCTNSTWVELVSKAKFFWASLPSLPPKGGLVRMYVEEFGGLFEQRGIGGAAGQGVAVPEVGLVDAVQHQIGQRDRENQVLLFAAEEGVVLEGVDIGAGGALPSLRAMCS